jgi:hypothetical protein
MPVLPFASRTDYGFRKPLDPGSGPALDSIQVRDDEAYSDLIGGVAVVPAPTSVSSMSIGRKWTNFGLDEPLLFLNNLKSII